MRMIKLVCTEWNHGVTTSSDGWIQLDIFKMDKVGKIVERHPLSGTRWKYKTQAQCEVIRDFTDKLGLKHGSLKVFTGRA